MSKFLPTEIHDSGLPSPFTVFSSCRCQINVAGLWIFRHRLSDDIPLPKVNARYATASYCPPCTNPKTDSKALLFCSAILNPDPEMHCLFALLFTGFILLLALKVLGRMEGFKEGRSVSTSRASKSHIYMPCHIPPTNKIYKSPQRSPYSERNRLSCSQKCTSVLLTCRSEPCILPLTMNIISKKPNSYLVSGQR
jgi:hypothetical protein